MTNIIDFTKYRKNRRIIDINQILHRAAEINIERLAKKADKEKKK